jgi:opacity protein-like surface antigen
MRRLALVLAVVLAVVLASAVQASAAGQWVPGMGPGANPEMDAWYANWTTTQNGRFVRTYTPATEGACRRELHDIMRLNPPVITYYPYPWPNDKTIFYPPAYREAKHCQDWMRFWPVYQP